MTESGALSTARSLKDFLVAIASQAIQTMLLKQDGRRLPSTRSPALIFMIAIMAMLNLVALLETVRPQALDFEADVAFAAALYWISARPATGLLVSVYLTTQIAVDAVQIITIPFLGRHQTFWLIWQGVAYFSAFRKILEIDSQR